MSSSSNEYIVYCLNGVLGAVNLCKIDRLHHSWRAKQEGTIADSSCCGNNLTSTSIDWLGSERAAQDLKFNIFNGLFTKGSFLSRPLEALDHEIFH